MATEQTTSPSPRTLRFGLPAVLILFAAAGVVSYFGIRPAVERRLSADFASNPSGVHAPSSPVVSIALPYDEPELPPGPHREEFQVACTSCHSTRLALTQPPFPKAKWVEVVHKMAATYGAPLNAEDEAHAVDYIATVRGK